jgi:hypothetical protein
MNVPLKFIDFDHKKKNEDSKDEKTLEIIDTD